MYVLALQPAKVYGSYIASVPVKMVCCVGAMDNPMIPWVLDIYMPRMSSLVTKNSGDPWVLHGRSPCLRGRSSMASYFPLKQISWITGGQKDEDGSSHANSLMRTTILRLLPSDMRIGVISKNGFVHVGLEYPQKLMDCQIIHMEVSS